MVTVRVQRPDDWPTIMEVLRSAFGSEEESVLVDALRKAGKVTLSMVAENDGRVVGCIVFSPVMIEDGGTIHEALGLGPVAVLPGFQGLGIGSRLIEEGLDTCRQAGHHRVVVLGHPSYYPRFGFVPASEYGVSCTYDVPENAFMALALTDGAFDGVRGIAHYAPEFDRAA